MENKKPRKKVPEMTREEKLSLIAFKNVMERKAKVKAETKTEQTYLTEAHKKNSEAAIKTSKNINPLNVNWEKESEAKSKETS